MGLPVVKYTIDGQPEVEIQFERGPRDFQCAYAGRVHDNLATSGVRERVTEHLDMKIAFTMPAMQVGGDLAAWGAFMAFALAGGMFTFAPNAQVPFWFHCVSDDEEWQPARVGRGVYSAVFRWRVVPDELAPASPAIVLERFMGIAE